MDVAVVTCGSSASKQQVRTKARRLLHCATPSIIGGAGIPKNLLNSSRVGRHLPAQMTRQGAVSPFVFAVGGFQGS